MHSSALILGLASVAAATWANNTIEKRGGEWRSPDGGNLDINASGNIVNWGSASPREIIEGLYMSCDPGGCEDINEQDTAIYKRGNFADEMMVHLTIQSDYEVWIKNGLIEAMGAGVEKTTEVRPKKWLQRHNCKGKTIGDCEDKDMQLDEHWAPERMNIRFTDPVTKEHSSISYEMDIVEKESDTWCEDVFTVGSAVGGMINGVAGGIFQLAAFLC